MDLFTPFIVRNGQNQLKVEPLAVKKPEKDSKVKLSYRTRNGKYTPVESEPSHPAHTKDENALVDTWA